MRDGIPESGDVLANKYLIEGPIGQGAMGMVFAAVHLMTEKRLAIKCLLPQHARDEGSVERFMREARAAGRIHHRHVIDVFDVGSSGGVPFIVMPHLDGKTLTELLREEELSLDHVLLVMLRAMEGVHAAHCVGIIHRDLKPCNIFVCRGVSGRLDDPKVLDFGISKDMDEADRRLTQSGTVVGTPYYMALEQLTGRRDIDVRVDVYAVGVILYEALASEPPYRAENAAGLAIQMLHVPPKHLALVRPDLPEGLADVVMRALARDRESRFADMSAFTAALAPYASGSNTFSPEPQGPRLRTRASALASPMAKTTVGNTASLQSGKILRAEAQASKGPGPLSRQGKAWLFASGAAAALITGLVFWSSNPESSRPARDPLPSARPMRSEPGAAVPSGAGEQASMPLAATPQAALSSEDAAAAPASPEAGEPPPPPSTARAKRRTAPRVGARPDAAAAAANEPAAATAPAPVAPKPNELSPEQF